MADVKHLEILWERRRKAVGSDFAIGPGDVLQISVPAIEQLKDIDVRVSGDNTIALPLVGVVQVSGMTEQEVREELRRRLEKYMYKPQVEVFVKEYQSRRAAVLGAVDKPGLYTLTSRSDTILGVISRAGGMTDKAGTRVILIPGPPVQYAGVMKFPEVQHINGDSQPRAYSVREQAAQPQKVTAISASGKAPGSATDSASQSSSALISNGESSVLPKDVRQDEIMIDLSDVSSRNHLDLPARPGDVIIVPPAGEVMVEGWVQNPGAFNITPGMTVLGAVAAAGGPMFSQSAEVIRAGQNGGKAVLPVDLAMAERGSQPAVALQAGDVVIVKRSAIGAAPYFFYLLFSRFGTGMFIPAP